MSISDLPLGYCTNLHPGRTLAEVEDGLGRYTAEVSRRTDRSIAAGLWLSRSVVSELLSEPDAVARFRDRLIADGLSCYTLNTFPFGDFHDHRVKENVYLPDWSDPARRDYTLDCARVLSGLLPENVGGSLSTLPLGGTMNRRAPGFHRQCFRQISDTAKELGELFDATGALIRLAIEPEPLCELSSIPNQVLPWFSKLREYAADAGLLDVVSRHVGLCLDVCHQAVEFEDLSDSIELLTAHEIRINKVHITCAVELSNPATNAAGRSALARFVEPRYLHQTFARFSDGQIRNRLDLESADVLRDEASYTDFDRADAWRVHFHVPVNAEQLGPLNTTRQELRDALAAIARLDYAPHLEIETYTWDMMPGHEPVDLVTGLQTEIDATYELLSALHDGTPQ